MKNICEYTYENTYTMKYVFEPPEYDGIRNYFSHFRPKLGDIVVDAGAYTGVTFSLLASQMIGPTGVIYAFEPDPFNSGRLLYNIQLNRINNIRVIPKGLWHENGTIPFFSKHTGGSCFFPGMNAADPTVDEFPVEVVKLDDMFPKIDFLKMDIEGSELEALQGAQRLLTEGSPKCAIEVYHVRHGSPTLTRVKNFLESLHYTVTFAPTAPLTLYGEKNP